LRVEGAQYLVWIIEHGAFNELIYHLMYFFNIGLGLEAELDRAGQQEYKKGSFHGFKSFTRITVRGRGLAIKYVLKRFWMIGLDRLGLYELFSVLGRGALCYAFSPFDSLKGYI